jgi:hypothetical protein
VVSRIASAVSPNPKSSGGSGIQFSPFDSACYCASNS